MRSFLEAAGWHILDVDILLSKEHDLSVQSISDKVLARISNNEFDACLISPPCDTFTRSKFSPNGPPPQRNFDNPNGFTWLTGKSLHSVRIANSLANFAFKAAMCQARLTPGLLFVEFPEDLGACPQGKFKGMRPASIWQLPSFLELLAIPGIVTGGLRQKDFGTAYVKPTRLVFKAMEGFENPKIFMGPPVFDSLGFYQGPIPKLPWSQGVVSLARRAGEDGFRTTGTAAWPPQLCKFIADHLVMMVALLPTSSTDSLPGAGFLLGDSGSARVELPEVPFPTTVPPPSFWVGGSGPPRQTFLLGKTKPFHDGCGLTSAGRWPKHRRQFPSGARWCSLRRDLEGILTDAVGEQGIQRIALQLACTPTTSPFSELWIAKGRRILHDWLVRNCGDFQVDRPAGDISPGQPFLLHSLHFLLKELVDADYQIVRTMMTGVTAGILQPLPRTPAIYEEQTSWRLKQDPFISAEFSADNYSSVEPHLVAVEALFRADEADGLMLEYSNQAFSDKFGSNAAISALAVLVEKDKLRVLHDGTRTTRVNHRVRCRDRQRMPGVAEVHTILREARARKALLFSLLGDFKGAHRCVKILESEWGMLACRLGPDSVWVNKVGTFGCSSAAYWWGRLAGALTRGIHGLLGQEHMVDLLLFADDINMLLDGPADRKSAVLAIFYFIIFGAPLKWAKCRGGFSVDWVGLFLCMKEYSVGLSASRADWMVAWLAKILAAGRVATREMAGGLGRLNFAATALIYEKAFLGILYLWVSAILRGAAEVVSIPWAVRLILTWIHRRLCQGNRMQVVPALPARTQHELFRSDAKAEAGVATIGGWECAGGTPAEKARWFFVRVEESWAPWAFAKNKDPQRVIATLELLGTLLCIMVFGSRWSAGLLAAGVVTGSTDNQGNTYAVAKLLSTKWPLTTLLVELSEQLRSRELCLHLLWRKRELNCEADQLTNSDFSSFDAALEVKVDTAALPWLVLDELMESSRLLYQDIVNERSVASKGAKQAFVWKKTAANKRFRVSQPW